MSDEHDSWLSGIGINVENLLKDVAEKVEDTAAGVARTVKKAASNVVEAAETATGLKGGQTVPPFTNPLGPPVSPAPGPYYLDPSGSPYAEPPAPPKPPPPSRDPSLPLCPPYVPCDPVIAGDNLPSPGHMLASAALPHDSPSASPGNPTTPPGGGGSAGGLGGCCSASVGRGGKNKPADVRAVQEALNAQANAGLAMDGKCGPRTIKAIEAFQKSSGQPKPDGRIDPGKATARALGLAGGAGAVQSSEQ